jgi:hypothetical protein
MRQGINWRLLGGVLGVVGLVGCNNVDRPAVTQLQEGLNLLDARDPSWGTNAAYVKAGRVIYIETRMGSLKPEIYRAQAPNEPANEIDVRFVDQKGGTFFVQRGGDSYVDPTWAADIRKHADQTLRATQADRDMDWVMAKEAGTLYVKALPATFKDHGHDIEVFSKRAPVSRDPELKQALVDVAKEHPIPAAEVGKGWWGNSTWLQTYTALYSGKVCRLWICPADHSATIMYVNPNVGYWQMAISANNHGRGYNGSGMGYRCYSGASAWKQYGASVSGSTAGDSTGAWDGQGGCQSPYSWNSGGYDHLCNSDAAYELWQGKEATWATSRGNDTTFTWDGPGNYACNCNNNNDCDGDWTRPNCP